MPAQWILLLIVAAAIGVWLDTMRQHDHALRAAQHICKAHDVQLLDHSVGLSALKWRRHDGRLTFERHYAFEISLNGNDRHAGTLWLINGRLVGVSAPWLKPPDVRGPEAKAEVTDLTRHLFGRSGGSRDRARHKHR